MISLATQLSFDIHHAYGHFLMLLSLAFNMQHAYPLSNYNTNLFEVERSKKAIRGQIIRSSAFV